MGAMFDSYKLRIPITRQPSILVMCFVPTRDRDARLLWVSTTGTADGVTRL